MSASLAPPYSPEVLTSRGGILKNAFHLRTFLLTALSWWLAATPCQPAEFVVIVTVDGLRSSVFRELPSTTISNFSRLRAEGIFTDNARTDFDWTFTNPNHVSILTARQVIGPNGHQYTATALPPPGQTLHSNRGLYLTSIYDIAHDRGLRTGAFVTKASQFSIIDTSYDADSGAPDVTGEDNGRDKIDVYQANDYLSVAITDGFLQTMGTTPCHLSWIHFADPDDAGHRYGWASSNYRNAVAAVDSYLGRILQLIETDPVLRARTTLIVTSDHGGTGTGHSSAFDPANYTIPLMVWGAHVPRGGDLYAINLATRRNPGVLRPSYSGPATQQPIRNIDAANLALQLLNLPAIPDAGALINRAQDLRLATFDVTIVAPENGGVRLEWASLGPGYAYRVERKTDPATGSWSAAPGVWPITATSWLDTEPPAQNGFYRVVGVALPSAGLPPAVRSKKTPRSAKRSAAIRKSSK